MSDHHGREHDSSPAAGALSQLAAETPTADELEPQLKYERLGADVKTILQDATATCLSLSEKVLALGTSAGNVHILDYSGNEVRLQTHTHTHSITSSMSASTDTAVDK